MRTDAKSSGFWALDARLSALPKGFRWLALAVGLGLAGYITYASLTPVVAMPQITNIDKVFHCLAYGALGACLLPGLSPMKARWTVVLLILMGIAIELGQAFAGLGRTGSWGDALANSLGAFGAYVGWAVLFALFGRGLTTKRQEAAEA